MKILYALLAIVAGATSVQAADGPSMKDIGADAPAIYQVHKASFGGFFVGASLNWNRLDVEHEGSIDWDCEYGGVACDLGLPNEGGVAGKLPNIDGKAISGGLRGGYMFQLGRLYGGPVVTADFGQVEAELNRGLIEDDGESIVNGKLSITSNWRAAAVLKGGVEVIERVGVYGFAGVGAVDISVEGSVSGKGIDGVIDNGSTGNVVNVMDYNETVFAFTYGAGVDVKLTDHLSAFAEWQRFDLDSFGGSKGVDCFAFTHDGDANIDAIKVGLNYNF